MSFKLTTELLSHGNKGGNKINILILDKAVKVDLDLKDVSLRTTAKGVLYARVGSIFNCIHIINMRVNFLSNLIHNDKMWLSKINHLDEVYKNVFPMLENCHRAIHIQLITLNLYSNIFHIVLSRTWIQFKIKPH